MPLRLLLATACCLVAFLLLPVRRASAQPPPPAIYVVEVRGDRLDPARVRAAVARELKVAAVAPDDPRATTAAGTIEVTADAAARTLRVVFRKPAAPVTRTVPLPDDPARAEIAAVFLAGNLARDEAGELLGALKKAPADAAAPAEGARARDDAPPSQAEVLDRDELRRLRMDLQATNDAMGKRIRALSVGLGVFTALTLPAGVALVAADRSSGSVEAGKFLLGAGIGGASTLAGTLLASGLTATADEKLQRKVAAIEAEGGSTAEVLARIDDAWRQQASEERTSRHTGAVLTLVIGTLAMGIDAAVELSRSRDDTRPRYAGVLYGLGAADIAIGIWGLMVESPFESSYASWHATRRAVAPASAAALRPSIGVAPLPGGAAISAGFVF